MSAASKARLIDPNEDIKIIQEEPVVPMKHMVLRIPYHRNTIS
jgi:hypothetical protein